MKPRPPLPPGPYLVVGQGRSGRAVAELLDSAGVSFAVLGDGETCTGDSARRAGNELLFQTLAAQNVETFGEFGVTKVVVTCAHCFNTIKNEYPQIGGNYEVVHHTQLLNRLVRDKKLVPVARPADVPGMSSAKNAASTAATSGSIARGNIWAPAYPTPTTATARYTAKLGSPRASTSAKAPAPNSSDAAAYPQRFPRAAPTRCHTGATSSAGPTKHTNRTVEADARPSTWRAT